MTTREFKDTVQARFRGDRRYRKELLREGVECLLGRDLVPAQLHVLQNWFHPPTAPAVVNETEATSGAG